MKRQVAIALAVAALLVGAAGGFFVGFSQRPQQAHAPSDPTRAAGKPADPAPEAVKVTPSDGGLREALDKIEIPALPTGNGMIRGVVMLDDGAPLTGVAIKAVPARTELRAATGQSLEDEVTDFIRQRRIERTMQRDAVTGADGRYELAGLADSGQYTFSAELAGYRITGPKNPVNTGETVNFTARAVAMVEIVVRLPDGSAPLQARLTLTRKNPFATRAPAWSPATKVELEPGKWHVTARVGEFNQHDGEQYDDDFISEPVPFEVVAGTPNQRVEVPLKACLIIKGAISVPASYTRNLIDVYLQAEPPAEPPPSTLQRDRDYKLTVTPRAHGFRFRFGDLEPGKYRLIVYDSTGGLADWRDVEAASGMGEVNLTMPELDRSQFIIVRVTGPGGEVLPDATIKLTLKGPGGTAGLDKGDMRGPDNTIWVRRVAKGAEPESMRDKEWEYQLTASHPLYPAKVVTYGRNDTRELEIKFSPAATLVLQPTGYTDHPKATRMKWGVAPRDRGVISAGMPVQHDGSRPKATLKFGPFEPGEYDVVLQYAVSDFDWTEVLRVPITLAAGENAVTAAVPALNTLTVALPKDAHDYVRLRRKGEITRQGQALPRFKDGRSTLDYLPAGDYVLFNDSGEIAVRVPGDSEVLFDPPPYNALRITCKAGSKVENLGLRDGDVIVTVDGQNFADIKGASALLQLSTDKEKTTWKVLRAGAEQDVGFDGREMGKLLKDDKNRDFTFMPAYR